jgi:hypothetical protein
MYLKVYILVRFFSYIQNFNLFTIMKKLTLFFVSLIINVSVSTAHEGPWTAARPDGHAPISVMGDHMHAMGEWMVSYRYMTMDMEGLLDGSNEVSKATATSNYSFSMMGNYASKNYDDGHAHVWLYVRNFRQVDINVYAQLFRQ